MMRLAGGLLLAIGLVIAALCGLCTGIFLINALVSSGSEAEFGLLALIIGGIPTLIGIGLVFLGRHLLRKAAVRDAQQEQAPDIFD